MLNQTLTTNFSAEEIIICGVASVVLGALITAAFGYKAHRSGSYMITVALIPLIVQVIIMLVNGNVGTGIAVMGAFGLVRFRSAQGSAIDICGVFLAMAVGLACGTRGSCKSNHVEPRVIFQQRCETLTNHSCCAYDTYIVLLFHN